jgi:hypothetical protein
MHPLVVISYNNHAYVNRTIVQAKLYGLRPIVVDNASIYEKTRTYLKSLRRDADVIQLDDNYGSRCWTRPELLARLPSRFFVTDPDLEWNPRLPKDFPAKLDALCTELGARKVGFALDISDISQMFQDADYFKGQTIQGWESQFWAAPVQHAAYELYEAHIDTTFHLFDKTTDDRALAYRVAGDFTAKHSPWYRSTTISAHDLIHMYVSTKTSTTAKLVLREMLRQKTLKPALKACERDCSKSITQTVSEIKARVQ